VNERIRVPQVRLIDQDGKQVGIVPTPEALRRAREAGLDLVEVAPHERPPVCRIMDYGKWKYQQRKKKKHTHEQQLKEIRLRPNTDVHDRQVKIERAREFLERGDRVLFTVLLRGRERFHIDLAMQMLNEIVENLADVSRLERQPRAEGRRITMTLVPHRPGARPKPTQRETQDQQAESQPADQPAEAGST